MAYIAQKPCSFAGQRYRVGEIIPEGVILPGAIKRLIKSGVVAESEVGLLLPTSASLDENEEEEMLTGHLDPDDLGSMDYQALKKLAKEMGLSTSGSKEVLIERITAETVMAPAHIEGATAEGDK